MPDKAPQPTARSAPLVALVVGPSLTYAAGPGVDETWPLPELVERFRALSQSLGPRWVIWSADAALRPIVSSGESVARSWDLAEAHRLIHGGWRATPGDIWAACHGLDPATVPRENSRRRAGFDRDLFEDLSAAADSKAEDDLIATDRHLPVDLLEQAESPDQLREIARAALQCQQIQADSIAADQIRADRHLATVWSESAAAVLCLELERDGLPVDRAEAEVLIAQSAGPRPQDESDAVRIRGVRDHVVLRHAPGRERTDLRNPGQVRALLSSVGVDVPDTRRWTLEPYRQSSPLVDALLSWRKDERIATTYGYRWLDEHVGRDDRLRGAWTASDGAAGRMTAQNGLHNLPAPLRPAIAAASGQVFVRADLGQIEPRVLAVVSGDPAFAEATRADDLYAPVAAKLGSDRAVAKIAVLAAMYGQRSGAAGEALRDLEAAYPVAMGVLDRAYAAGLARAPLRTWGGRLIRLGQGTPLGEGAETTASAIPDSARGRYARNAIIQGSAAELFKAWAATVRVALRPIGGQIVLCLHDELLVHVPEPHAAQAAGLVDRCLQSAARAWARTDAVRFVTDTSIVQRWSEAKA